MADAGDDLGPVGLDRLAGAATVAALAPGKVDDEVVGSELEPCRDPFDRDPECRAVRLAGGQESERCHLRVRRGSGDLARPSAGASGRRLVVSRGWAGIAAIVGCGLCRGRRWGR